MRTILAALCATVLATQSCGQPDSTLKDYFVGKTVILKVDIPDVRPGLEVFAEPRRPLDPARHAALVQANGLAIKNGDSATITGVAIKDKLVEFQLGTSRINLRYEKGVPDDLTPGQVMAQLADYIEFPFTDRVIRKRP